MVPHHPRLMSIRKPPIRLVTTGCQTLAIEDLKTGSSKASLSLESNRSGFNSQFEASDCHPLSHYLATCKMGIIIVPALLRRMTVVM